MADSASQEAAGRPRPASRIKRILPLVFGLALTVIAFVALDIVVTHVSYDEVRDAVAAMPPGAILACLLFTALSFLAMSTYDVIATRTVVPGKVKPSTAALVGAAGYAVSNALGFPLLTGGALRYRLYRAADLDPASIGKIVGTSFFALWFAFAVLVGLTLIADPRAVPFFDRIDPAIDIAIGIVLIAAVGGLLVWLGRAPRRLAFRGSVMPLPSSRHALAQIVAGIVDLTAAAAALYVLMPQGSVSSFFIFALIFTLATVAGMASHAPAGLGAFEATILAGLGLGADPNAIAALIVYRLIYTALPLVVAVVVLAGAELVRQRSKVADAARAVQPMIPPLSAAITFAGGVVLLISGSTPTIDTRLAVLRDILPLPFVEVSHLLSSLVGVVLLVIARGLALRLHRAFVLALCLLLSGAVFALAKGLDWEEALTLAFVALALTIFRHAFYRRTQEGPFALSWRWLAGIAAVVVAFVWLGFFSYSDVAYSNALWWEFAVEDDAPRFLRAGVLVVAVVVVAAVYLWVNGRPRAAPASEIPPEVLPLVEASSETAAWLALLGDKAFMLSPERDAFLMYARSGGSLVALGEPVGAPAAAEELAWAFRASADRQALRPVFYEVGAARLPLFLDMGLTALKLGEVARVDLATFDLKGSKRQSLRSAVNRAEREGMTFRIVPRDGVPKLMPTLRRISDAWLESKSGSEKGFSLGYFDERYLSYFDVAVLEEHGEIVAFANLWRSGGKNEMSIDLMRHLPSASHAVMETLFVKLILNAREEGYRWFNLGAAPLSGLTDRPGASRWNRFGSLLYRRGGDFYRFDGLRGFKQKFGPVWTPHYLVCPPGLDAARALVDVTTLVSRRVKARAS
ncbi:bifunctional lysylphosphatidylglycerol flippase/synthetase MprF [Aureimonas mangrovi]|uniref:bifunctional lysylphosphatidylglycerol flippase/synthetase MprF n=1 Tax=Aureimonas mangrovi TaxID=2758041 RepID=UPI001FE423C8|nr:bifunctional lysylphosphatidylglycerol flippase/synthetase MprF [Aureimonas mangrovi]